MTTFNDNEEAGLGLHEEADGQNTMAVLNTLGGGEDALAEGEPMGLDPNAGKAKISGSSLAVGVVIVLAVAALLGMRMTLSAIAASDSPADAMAAIDTFIQTQAAAVSQGEQGPIKAPDEESKQVLEELKVDPTDHQVPAEKVESNPFDLSKIVVTTTTTKNTGEPKVDDASVARDRAKRNAAALRVDSISGKMAFINGELYRIGDTIGNSGFKLIGIDGLKCKIKTTDQFGFEHTLVYR